MRSTPVAEAGRFCETQSRVVSETRVRDGLKKSFMLGKTQPVLADAARLHRMLSPTRRTRARGWGFRRRFGKVHVAPMRILGPGNV
jgi:hypothetical protein